MEGDAIKKYTLQMMGKVWRAHKSRLTKKLDARPSHVKPAEWETFIKKKTSKAFMVCMLIVLAETFIHAYFILFRMM